MLDSCPWQPRRGKILKFDFMSGGSNQGSGLLSRVEERERSLEHMDNCFRSCLSPPGSTGVGEFEFQGS